MTVRHGHTAPVMRPGTRLHRDNTRHLIHKQLRQPSTGYRSVEDNDAISPDATNLKTVLRKVDRQYANLRHGCLPHLGSNKTTLAHSMPSRGGIHRIRSGGLAHLAETGFYREVRVEGYDSILTRILVATVGVWPGYRSNSSTRSVA